MEPTTTSPQKDYTKTIIIGLIICLGLMLLTLKESLTTLQDLVDKFNPLIAENNLLREKCNEIGVNPLQNETQTLNWYIPLKEEKFD